MLTEGSRLVLKKAQQTKFYIEGETMEIQVQELIDKIRKDGIDTAAQEASEIKTDAQAEAQRIIESAKKEAEKIISQSKQDAERNEKAGIAVLQQASRNLVLAFKDEIQTLLDKLVNERVCENYSEDVLKHALPEVVKNWGLKSGEELAVILPENELAKLRDYFTVNLKNELCKGIELKSNRKLNYGFHISNKDGSAYYDFSSDAVAELLSAYINPYMASLLKDALKGM